ncbi:unnamed protein product [Spirodela intermedia]|uniref:Uncharacterized protein n=1 Tax=Spirodela intermedia TaxID=51605 RepID=A0A7I8KZC1_SPIIN|nr:unnamed protein product [Spirodela intermedia]
MWRCWQRGLRRRTPHWWQRRHKWDAPEGVAVHLPRQEALTLAQESLLGLPGEAVPSIVKRGQLQARRGLSSEKVVRVGEVLQVRKQADALGNFAGQEVVSYIQLLQADHPAEARRQRPDQLVVADVQHRQAREKPDLRREARPKAVVYDNDLVESLGHVAEARREATLEVVVGEDDHRHRRVAEVVGEIEGEAVVVDENGIEILVEELTRHLSLELVESDVEELERREAEDHPGELAGETVVAQIELEEELQILKLVRDRAAEAVRVDVEQREVLQQAELLRKIPGDVPVVEIYAGDHGDVPVIERRGAEHAGVLADAGSDPVAGQIERIGEDSLLPGLESNVGGAEARVWEEQGGIDSNLLSAVAKLVAVVEELPLPDEAGLGIGESMAGEAAIAALSSSSSPLRRGEHKDQVADHKEAGQRPGRMPSTLPHLITPSATGRSCGYLTARGTLEAIQKTGRNPESERERERERERMGMETGPLSDN